MPNKDGTGPMGDMYECKPQDTRVCNQKNYQLKSEELVESSKLEKVSRCGRGKQPRPLNCSRGRRNCRQSQSRKLCRLQ